jgi:elongation factor Ts
MAISAKDVQKLREMTGVGMMDCKKALTASEGDFDKAVEWLREKGLAAAAKKAGKVAAEGVSFAYVNEAGVGAIVEVNSQTDFVAKNDQFQAYVKDVAAVIADKNPADVDALMGLTYPGTDRTVQDVQNDKVLAIGENIKVRRFARYATGLNVPYIHMGGKIGVLVNMEVVGDCDTAKVVELGKDIAMQIAAMNPTYLDKADVDQATLDKEKEILLIQAKEENSKLAKPKPDNIVEKMVLGRIGKYYEENCLMQQAFVKENKSSVEQHVAAVAKELGVSITVKAFTRFVTGEGIEVQESDFAAEVASMIK